MKLKKTIYSCWGDSGVKTKVEIANTIRARSRIKCGVRPWEKLVVHSKRTIPYASIRAVVSITNSWGE
jgi:hypothetical protein